MADGDHHILFGDHVLNREIGFGGNDFGAALIAVTFADLLQLLLDDSHAETTVFQDGLELLNKLDGLPVFDHHLLHFQGSETVQPHIQDGLGLALREIKGFH